MPAACREGDLAGVDWPHFLDLVCQEEVKRQHAAQAAVDVLAKFTREAAERCMPGFVLSLFVIMGCGADQWGDQIVRFYPDGRARFLVGAWRVAVDGDSARWHQWSVTSEAAFDLPPPFPAWPFPGRMESLRSAQDLTRLSELPTSLRCNAAALSKLEGCGGDVWAGLLTALCERCTPQHPHGLPCLYDEPLLLALEALFEAHRDRTRQPDCPHGLLAAILSLGGRMSHVPADTHEKLWRVAGQPVDVVNVCFRQVLEDLNNRFEFNVPMIDLSPFPFHMGALRSARSNVRADEAYHEAFLGAVSRLLAHHGVLHVLLPGNGPVESLASENTRSGESSFFVPHETQDAITELLELFPQELEAEFGGIWRFVKVSAGLWQVGEEPYRFSPRAGVAYEVFCKQCEYVSIYFYARPSRLSLLPLASWSPCVIPLGRVFPTDLRHMGGVAVPVAADTSWLRMAQRPPFLWTPDSPVAFSGVPPQPEIINCREAWRLVEALWRPSAAAGEVMRPPPTLTPEFDLSAGVHPGMSLFDLMRQREDSEREGLHSFSDKMLFKTRLLREGIPVPKIYFMSNTLPNDLEDILSNLGTERFVAKPTHLAATSFVYAMRDGINIVNGQPTSFKEVAEGLAEAWQDRHLDDWATESTAPGLIVEELIEPCSASRPRASTPDELKCQTFFGEMFFCEWVYVKNMTTGDDGAQAFQGAHEMGDRAQPTLGHRTYGIPNFQTRGIVFRDRSCYDCEEMLPLSAERWEELIKIVEHVAEGTDHIRIDVFITPDGRIVVNEANISFLKISKWPQILVEEMRRRWLDGYRRLHS